jgi:hypothetical protein
MRASVAAAVGVAPNEWTMLLNDRWRRVLSSDWQLWWDEVTPLIAMPPPAALLEECLVEMNELIGVPTMRADLQLGVIRHFGHLPLALCHLSSDPFNLRPPATHVLDGTQDFRHGLRSAQCRDDRS